MGNRAEQRLSQIAKYDRLIERTLDELNTWRYRIESSGYMDTMERVKYSADLQRSQSMIAFYIDFESECRRKIEHYSTERSKIIELIEQLNGVEYDVIYLTYVERLLRYEIADRINKSESLISKAKKSGLENIERVIG